MGRREQQIKQLVLSRVAKCGQCGSTYELSDVSVLGSKEDLWFLMLICAHCHQAVGVAAVVKEQSATKEQSVAREQSAAPGGQDRGAAAGEQAGPDGTQMVPPSRQDRPVATDPVTTADVGAMRDFLLGFDGDFKRLFEEHV